MAEKEETTQVDGTGDAPKKNPLMKIIILLLVVIILAGGGLAIWKSGLIGGGTDKEAEANTKDKKGVQTDIGPIFPLETFIVNLSDPQGKKYLKAKLELELDNEEVILEIEKRLPQLRDTVLTVLSSKGFEDIRQLEGKYQLRVELIALLNQHLKTGKVKNIYFTEFIVQ
jgi:flagellar FliL protein